MRDTVKLCEIMTYFLRKIKIINFNITSRYSAISTCKHYFMYIGKTIVIDLLIRNRTSTFVKQFCKSLSPYNNIDYAHETIETFQWLVVVSLEANKFTYLRLFLTLTKLIKCQKLISYLRLAQENIVKIINIFIFCVKNIFLHFCLS